MMSSLSKRYLLIVVLLTFAAASSPNAFAGKVTGWRGDGSGRFSAVNPPLRWSETKNIVWKVKMPGRSNSQPVFAGGRVFICSEPNLLICLDRATGKIRWQRSNSYRDVVGEKIWAKVDAELKQAAVHHSAIRGLKVRLDALEKQADSKGETPALIKQLERAEKAIETEEGKLKSYPLAAKYRKPGTHQRMNGYTTATPTTDGKHIWAVFGNAVVVCYDLKGNRRWIRKLKDLPHSMFGHSASPLLVGRKLIVNIEDTVALDADSGRELWRTGYGQSWGSAIRVKFGGVDHLALPSGKFLRVSDGKIVTRAPFVLSDSSAVIQNGIVYYIQNRGGAVRLPAKSSDKFKIESLWKTNPKGTRYFAAPVIRDGLIYTVSSRSIFAVIDAKDGRVLYQKRLNVGRGTAYPSVVLAGDVLYVSSDNGTTVVIKPGRKYIEIARNRIEGFISTPVVSADRVYIRTYGHLYCIGR
ncbi:MAG: PQQ-binding-like beta-propeller repeat protein [Planctomycetes bacterium]|nr:PQQ-binding-like beta-propeller repeat protein [Planctomycetota bacterium]